MSYDTWKTTDTSDSLQGDFGDVDYDPELDLDLDIQDPADPTDDLEYRAEVTERLVEAVDEFLTFGSEDELIRLIGGLV